jgi:HSP20 family protein
MQGTGWDPFAGNTLSRFQNEVNQLFNRYAGDGATWPNLANSYPPLNLWEDGESVYVEAELPGMRENQLDIFVGEHDQLTIQGERKADDTQKGSWHRQERGFGKFSRVITLPAPVEADKVEARLEDGVLLLKLPKSQAAKPRKIAVKAQ